MDLLRKEFVRKEAVKEAGVVSEYLFITAPLLTTAMLNQFKEDTLAKPPRLDIAQNAW